MKSLLSLLLFPALLLSEEETPLPGHSHVGEAFDEGPRQSATLLANTGQVDFPITTSWDQGQAFFHQGLGQLHGFWYYEAERSFRELAAHDPDCAMAYWGMVMANWENAKRAKGFIDKAVALKDKATPRERLYIDTQANFLDGDPKDDKQRRQHLINDYENIVHEFPDDLEAKAILVCRIWQFSRQGLPIHSHEAVNALLEQVFAKAPMHPAHHFRIHLWDKHKASRALDSAAKLGHTAPGIAHMWHMPGHTYSDLKRYEDSAWHQQASARIDHGMMLKSRVLPDQIHNYAHNNEWLLRNWINTGRAHDALEMAKSLIANPRHPKLNTPEKGNNSAAYGRQRLLDVLTKFELWDEALALADSPYLLEDDLSPAHQRDRLELIGSAHFGGDDQPALTTTIAQLAALLTEAEAAHEKATTEARDKAKADKKSDKDIEKAEKDAGKKPGELVKSIKNACSGLEAYLAILQDDKDKARELFGNIKRDKYALALLRLRLGDEEEALKLSEEALNSAPNEVLPLAARIEILEALHKTEELAEAFRDFVKISAYLDLDAPPLKRLNPIAASLGLPDDWKLPITTPDDVGQRPALDTLGPLAWTPPTAPSFTLPDGDSHPVALASLQDRPLILIFYLGYGCLHCAEQLEAFSKESAKFEAAGFNLLAVSTDTVADLHKAREAYVEGGEEFPFTLLADPEHTISRQYNAYDDFENQPLHGTFLITPTGRVLWQDISADPFADPLFLLRESQRLLKLHP